jgi:ubiquinone/menaquinone biosynthesis C-methylase UbiE
MYDFKSDYDKWCHYARKLHERNLVGQDLYCLTQSIVEKKAHREVARTKTDRTRILEIGGGGGEHIVFEKNITSNNYVVIDIEKDFLNIIRKHFDIITIAADGCELPFKADSFSTIIATSVFEHVAQLEKVLLEIKRILTKEGDLLVIVPINGSLIIEIYKLLISYPFMFFNGIKKPNYIWNYLNVNSFKRINALLHIHFLIASKRSIPFNMFLPFLSPLYFYHCRKQL